MIQTNVASLALVALLGSAPYQCGRESDSSDMAHEESPDDALAAVADRLHAAGDLVGEREVLRYLIERFPRSRRVTDARSRLGDASGDAGAVDAAR